MGFAKFVGAGLGWTVGGPIGSILGFAFGSLIDGISQRKYWSLKTKHLY